MFIIMRLHRVTPPGKREPERTQKEKRGRWIENIKKIQMEGPKTAMKIIIYNRRSDSKKIQLEMNEPTANAVNVTYS